MTKEKFAQLCEQLHTDRTWIKAQKMNSYSDVDDVLSFFREQAVEAGLEPYQIWKSMLAKHLVAIYRHMDGRDPNPSESMLGRFADAINYLELGYAITQENGEPTKIKSR